MNISHTSVTHLTQSEEPGEPQSRPHFPLRLLSVPSGGSRKRENQETKPETKTPKDGFNLLIIVYYLLSILEQNYVFITS